MANDEAAERSGHHPEHHERAQAASKPHSFEAVHGWFDGERSRRATPVSRRCRVLELTARPRRGRRAPPTRHEEQDDRTWDPPGHAVRTVRLVWHVEVATHVNGSCWHCRTDRVPHASWGSRSGHARATPGFVARRLVSVGRITDWYWPAPCDMLTWFVLSHGWDTESTSV